MKYISKITFAIILSLTLFACSKDDDKLQDVQLIDNSETIAKLINSFDETIKTVNISKKLSDEEIGYIFFQEIKNQGLPINKINNSLKKSSNNYYDQSSKEYKEFALDFIDASIYSSKEEYQNHLFNLLENVKNSNINISEKQILVDNILLTSAFVDWMDTLTSKNKSNTFAKKKSWWNSWGKCVAGILGGAGTGALTFGLAGAAVGTVALPVVGTVSAGAVGAIGGAISGGLTGAAASC